MIPEPRIKAALFDVGGVIVRTEDKTPRAALAARFGLTYAQMDAAVFDAPTAKRASLGEIREEQHWQAVAQRFQLDAAALVEFRRQFWAGDAADPRLVAFIAALRPRMRTAILSNAWESARSSAQEKYGFLHAFDLAVYSAEVGLAKPDPRIYQFTLERLAVAPEQAVFVDDFPANVQAARTLGMHAILFRSFEQFCEAFAALPA